MLGAAGVERVPAVRPQAQGHDSFAVRMAGRHANWDRQIHPW